MGPEWARCIRRAAGGGVSVLQARSLEATVELLQSVSADLIVVGIEEFTQERLEALAGISSQAAEAVLTYVAPRAVIERFRREGMAEPGVWAPVEASADDRDEALRTAFELARLRADMAALNAGPVAAPVEPDMRTCGRGHPGLSPSAGRAHRRLRPRASARRLRRCHRPLHPLCRLLPAVGVHRGPAGASTAGGSR